MRCMGLEYGGLETACHVYRAESVPRRALAGTQRLIDVPHAVGCLAIGGRHGAVPRPLAAERDAAVGLEGAVRRRGRAGDGGPRFPVGASGAPPPPPRTFSPAKSLPLALTRPQVPRRGTHEHSGARARGGCTKVSAARATDRFGGANER